MDHLLAARFTMAFSLGFHIIFAAVGMVMPFFLALSYYLHLRGGGDEDLALTKIWSRGVAILFATGAVSGTVLSFELGLLWPGFMKHAGAIIGLPFAWEGAAFFLEAIALGLFLYGWKKLTPWTHWACTVVIGVAGLLSGIFVLSANGWMNSPTGFRWLGNRAVDIDPVAAMLNPAWFHQAWHMTVAAFEAVGFGVGGIHAWLYLKKKNALHRRAMEISLGFGVAAALVQPIIGDLSAKWVARHQPVKFAAMESHYDTATGAALHVGGLKIPGLLSWLAEGSTSAEVKGLKDFPQENWPNVSVVHLSFQVMVGLGFFLFGVGVLYVYYKIRKREFPRWLLWLFVFSAPCGWIALEAGWVVTEVGRQPWIIYGVMKTIDAVTPVPGMPYRMVMVIAVYTILVAVVTFLMVRQIRYIDKKSVKELARA